MARDVFERTVLAPARHAQPGLPSLRILFECSGQHAGAAEYDDRPGPFRERVKLGVQAWRAAMLRAVHQAIDLGQRDHGVDAEQLVFEIYGLLLALQHDARLLDRPLSDERAWRAFDALLERRGP